MNTISHTSRLTIPSSWLTIAALGWAAHTGGLAQGCIAVRGGGFCANGLSPEEPGAHVEAGQWQVSVGYRWLHSFRHFSGDEETHNALGQTREEAGTEVINDSHFFDLSVGYQFTPRFSASLVLPFAASDRSSLYEHKGNASGERYNTSAGGLGDLRVSGYAWLWNPETMPKGNLQLGLGLKAPTGDYQAEDTFHTTTGPETHYVDQSIQPGDGGWGFTAEMYAWRQLHGRFSAFLQAFYLFNPEDVNGASTETGAVRGKTIQNIRTRAAAGDARYQQYLENATALGYNNEVALEDVMSITDQYLVRGGLGVALAPKWGLSFSLAGRIEGVPVEDALGDSNGFRRPGYAVSIEPGLNWMWKRWSAQFLAPVALYRNRPASVADQRYGEITGAGTVAGDAAFADYALIANVAFRF